MEHILVVGAGPAGCATAIGLCRLGYKVSLLFNPKELVACHGISSRTLRGLRNAGLINAADSVATAQERLVYWNGQKTSSNTEQLLVRDSFDPALRGDAENAGIGLIPGLMRRWQQQPPIGLAVDYQAPDGGKQKLTCQFLVDARGRGGHGAERAELQGPATLSLLQRRRANTARPGSLVCSFEQGWAWVATVPGGETFVQLTVDAEAVQLPHRRDLDQWFGGQLKAIPALQAACNDSEPIAGITARASTSTLRSGLVSSHTLCVGDAAMAVDPLSGNGIFQALSSALVAPAVVNTLLRDSACATLAQTFYEERVRHSFLRFARTGRDFYRMESRWPDTAFWADRQKWPDAEPAHTETSPAFLGVEPRPVVSGGFIKMRNVAVTSDQPLGIWHVAEIELAPLLQGLPQQKAAREQVLQTRLQDACQGSRTRIQLVSAWLKRYNLL